MRVAILACLIGCGGCGGNAGNQTIDAPVDLDAPADVDAPLVVDARPPASHLVFLSFEGQVLSPAATDDALTNKWSLVPDVNPRQLLAWTPGLVDHAAHIKQVADEVSAILSPYDIDVVTVRPAIGPYHMIVYTHSQSQDLGFAPNLNVLSKPDCGTNASQVTVVFQGSETANFPHLAATAAVSSLGAFFGVESSAVPADCMCRDNANPLVRCTTLATCTVGGAGTDRAANSLCGTSGGTFDENVELLAKIGIHP